MKMISAALPQDIVLEEKVDVAKAMKFEQQNNFNLEYVEAVDKSAKAVCKFQYIFSNQGNFFFKTSRGATETLRPGLSVQISREENKLSKAVKAEIVQVSKSLVGLRMSGGLFKFKRKVDYFLHLNTDQNLNKRVEEAMNPLLTKAFRSNEKKPEVVMTAATGLVKNVQQAIFGCRFISTQENTCLFKLQKNEVYDLVKVGMSYIISRRATKLFEQVAVKVVEINHNQITCQLLFDLFVPFQTKYNYFFHTFSDPPKELSATGEYSKSVDLNHSKKKPILTEAMPATTRLVKQKAAFECHFISKQSSTCVFKLDKKAKMDLVKVGLSFIASRSPAKLIDQVAVKVVGINDHQITCQLPPDLSVTFQKSYNYFFHASSDSSKDSSTSEECSKSVDLNHSETSESTTSSLDKSSTSSDRLPSNVIESNYAYSSMNEHVFILNTGSKVDRIKLGQPIYITCRPNVFRGGVNAEVMQITKHQMVLRTTDNRVKFDSNVRYFLHDMKERYTIHEITTGGSISNLKSEYVADIKTNSASGNLYGSNFSFPRFQEAFMNKGEVKYTKDTEERFAAYPKHIINELQEDKMVNGRILKNLGAVKVKSHEIDVYRGLRVVVQPIRCNNNSIFEQMSTGMHAMIATDETITEQSKTCPVIIERISYPEIHLRIKDSKNQSLRFNQGKFFYIHSSIHDTLIGYYRSGSHRENPLVGEAERFVNKDIDREIEKMTSRFGNCSLKDDPEVPELVNSKLNDAQKTAIKMSLNEERKIVLIQGPPGTGKTRTLAELIAIMLKRKKKVLVFAPSHVAVKNVLDAALVQLEARGIVVNTDHLQVGTRQDLQEFIEKSAGFGKVKEMRKEQNELGMSTLEGKKKAKYNELENEIRKTIRQLEMQACKHIEVFFSTLGAGFVKDLKDFHGFHADLTIVDEASQTTEASVWPVVHGVDRCVLAGDPKQLPAVVKTNEARFEGFDVSLMERLLATGNKTNYVLLDVQYRMHESIMSWSNNCFYEGKLVADDSVRTSSLLVENRALGGPIFNPLVFFNTDLSKRSYREHFEQSIKNRGEALIVRAYLKKLISVKIDLNRVAIITGYKAQKMEIIKVVGEHKLEVDVHTVDEFQGQERDIIVFSFVRNGRSIGFLRDTRRGNVAVTRAKLQFVLIASKKMLHKNEHYSALGETIRQKGQVLNPDHHLLL